ncbi:MAG: S24/S26 family peptidase [Muribaculaceae bacterium]|nr:S24/S26 family peptidase [Muribaculaceae bacterium]
MNNPLIIDNETLLGEICILLSQGKRVKLRAKGNSMKPFIHGNEDILVLAPSGFLSMGDVVLARIDEKRYVVHRIIGIRGDSITLMGDGNLYEKEHCFRSDIYGIVEILIRQGKELNLGSPKSHLIAKIWRWLLPLRRIKVIISNKIKHK